MISPQMCPRLKAKGVSPEWQQSQNLWLNWADLQWRREVWSSSTEVGTEKWIQAISSTRLISAFWHMQLFHQPLTFRDGYNLSIRSSPCSSIQSICIELEKLMLWEGKTSQEGSEHFLRGLVNDFVLLLRGENFGLLRSGIYPPCHNSHWQIQHRHLSLHSLWTLRKKLLRASILLDLFNSPSNS